MIRILSYYDKYRELRGYFPESINVQFYYCASELPRLLKDTKHCWEIENILRVVEESRLEGDLPINKFIPQHVISFSEISSGCKTALLCYYMSVTHREDCYVNITECGSIATAEYLRIIDDSSVIGVLGVPINISCDFTDFDLEVDGKYASNWLAAVAAACKHLED